MVARICAHIRIFIFDNRVEIISPGALPNTVNAGSIKMGIHIERNPILVSMLKDIEGIPYRGLEQVSGESSVNAKVRG